MVDVKRIYVTRMTDNGDATLTVYAMSTQYRECHIRIGRNLLNSQAMWQMLEIAASKVDATAANLRIANVKQLED